MTRCYQILLTTILILLLSACNSGIPPKELAPDGDLIKKAILLEVKQTQQNLSQQLNTPIPDLEINRINVKAIEPLFIGKLPTYHLQGTYNLNLKLLRQQVKQKDNSFDIYLQRQIQGKTWRLLKQSTTETNDTPQWLSYQIDEWY